MRAARYLTGGPDAGVLEIVDRDVPEPGPGEVRVRVAVSGVNPTDWKSRKGGGLTAVGLDEVIPNQDGAGVVEAVGAGVDERRVGERVWLWLAQWQRSHGTAAELVTLPSEHAVALPDGSSLDLGAGLGIPAMTAHRCLFSGDGIGEGDAVLVHGGAGAVGHAAIELAAWRGARVAATVSSDEKAQLAGAAGAELVVNYRDEDVVAAVRAWAPDGVRRVVEVDLPANADVDAEVIGEYGVVSTYAVSPKPMGASRTMMIRNAAIEFVLVYTMPEAAKRQAVADITDALRDGALTGLPVRRFGLEDIAAAHDAVEAGFVGKVLVDLPG
jgi:NADPH2:quinone reductase